MQNFYNPLDPTGPVQVPDPKGPEHAALIGCLHVIAGFMLGGIFLALIMLMTGCTTTKYVTVPEIHHDTVRITKEQRDSIFLRDSIYVHEEQKGDTVLMRIEKWHTKYHDRLLRDTMYIARRDTVGVPYPVEKKVPAQLSWFKQMQIWLGRIVLIALAIFAGILIFKKRTWWLAILRKLL